MIDLRSWFRQLQRRKEAYQDTNVNNHCNMLFWPRWMFWYQLSLQPSAFSCVTSTPWISPWFGSLWQTNGWGGMARSTCMLLRISCMKRKCIHCYHVSQFVTVHNSYIEYITTRTGRYDIIYIIYRYTIHTNNTTGALALHVSFPNFRHHRQFAQVSGMPRSEMKRFAEVGWTTKG